MQYEKHVKDSLGDPARVWTGGGHVGLQYPQGERNMAYTPKQARRLARALKRAANVAEGKPAKAPKPAVIVDGEGDRWRHAGRGLYTCEGHELDCTNPDLHVRQTPDAIREAYGIRDEG